MHKKSGTARFYGGDNYSDAGGLRASPQQTKDDRRRIKELERELRRKDKALAETAALLVLSKEVEAIFSKGEAE